MLDGEITLGALARIDWKKIYVLPWHLDIEEELKEKHGVEYWNERTKTMYEGEDYFSERAMAFLNFAKIPKGSSVIDIASGIGALAIPLLKDDCEVTAVDVSDYALSVLEEKNVYDKKNLKIVNGYFREIAETLKPCDYVLNFCSLGVVCLDGEGKTDLADTLLKMNDLARERVIITMPANEEKDVAEVHANSYYWILYGALLSLGIIAELKFEWFDEVGTLGFISWKPVTSRTKKI